MRIQTPIASRFALFVCGLTPGLLTQPPLPSWNDTPSKKSITAFVGKVTSQGSPDLVPAAERIVKALAPQHPKWKAKEPFASLLKGDLKGALAGGERAMMEIMMATHAGRTTEEFEKIAKDWIATARHPETNRPYTGMVYQPMRELLAYLRVNRFRLQMLPDVAAGSGPRFCHFVHHTDAEWEWSYDRQSSIGRFDKGLDEARAKGCEQEG